MTHVPYRRTLPALNDVIAGTSSSCSPIWRRLSADPGRQGAGARHHHRAAVRSAPELPPLAEVGVPDSIGPPRRRSPYQPRRRKTSPTAQRSDHRDDRRSRVTKQLSSLQFIPVGKGTPEELDRFVKNEATRWGKVLTQAGVAGSM